MRADPSIETAFAHPRWAAANEAAIGKIMQARERKAGHNPGLPKSQSMGARGLDHIEPEHQALFDQLATQTTGRRNVLAAMRMAGSRVAETRLYDMLRAARARN